MLAGAKAVLEIGCGDAFASRIVLQEVGQLSVTDFDPLFFEDIRARTVENWRFAAAFVHDMLSAPPPGTYDGIYALDVLEHISPADETRFLTHMVGAHADS
jgi:cyclopropane fatty-acyl-phospholipid synthase-like methyltransferase